MLIGKSVRHAVIPIGAVRIDLEQLSKNVLSFCRLFLLKINHSKTVLRDHIPWIQRNDALHLCRSIVVVALRAVSACQSAMGGREIRSQVYGLLKFRNRLVRLPLMEKSNSALSMKHIRARMLQPHHTAEYDKSPNQQHGDAAQKVVLCRSDLRDQRAEQ